LAQLLRDWLDEANLAVDDVLRALKPVHFTSGRVPCRTTVSARLAGVGLEWDFVEAMADICSKDIDGQNHLMVQARACQERVTPARQHSSLQKLPAHHCGERADSEVRFAAELVRVQQRSLAVS
jgi:hypothetical protein